MRNPAIPLTLLSVALVACSDVPTGPGDSAAADTRVASAAVPVPFRGIIAEASHTSEYDMGAGTVNIHLVGTGQATHLGRFSLVSHMVGSLTSPVGTEQMTITAANGDVLTTTGTTQATPAGDGTLSAVSVATITGGTGRFAGATGTVTVRHTNLAPDRSSSGTIEGTIQIAN